MVGSLQCFLITQVYYQGFYKVWFENYRSLVGCHINSQRILSVVSASVNVTVLYWNNMIHDFSSVFNRHKTNIKHNS